MNAIDRMLYFLSSYDPGSTNHLVLLELLRNVREIPGLSINKLAELCNASAPTLSRLVKEMGFGSFASFKAGVAEFLLEEVAPPVNTARVVTPGMMSDTISENLTKNVSFMIDLMNTYREQEVIRAIEATARRMLHAHQICFFVHNGQIFSDLQKALFIDGKRAVVHRIIENASIFSEQLSRDDVIVATVFSVHELAVKQDVLARAYQRGVHNVLIANPDIPGLAELSENVFPIRDFDSNSGLFIEGLLSELILSAYRQL